MVITRTNDQENNIMSLFLKLKSYNKLLLLYYAYNHEQDIPLLP